jgi:tRNA nucleotidyltransferase (CCA-adding enzyme)
VKLVVSHINPDFDALASLALAKLIHPEAVAVASDTVDPRLEAFIHLYRDVLELAEPGEVDLDEVTELIVVDTNDPERIKPFDQLIGRVPITIYDHHPRPANVIPAAKGLHRLVGATASILTLLLQSRELAIPPELASLALLGIHEDTGDLSYAGTTPDDHEAAAHLLRSGGNLGIVQEFSRDASQLEHLDLLTDVLEAATQHDINGFRVVTSVTKHERYIQGIAPLCNQLLELHDTDAALLISEMEGKTLVIARAEENSFDLASALREAFGGGGHTTAAFARSDLPPESTLEKVLETLRRHTQAAPTAERLMSFPVKTIQEEATLAVAQEKLLQYGHNGLPVMNADGKLVGMISRRDLDRALRHNLGTAKVRGFMTKPVITATRDTSQRELEHLIQTHNIGRIPILDDGILVGIVTRSDLIAARHHTTSKRARPELEQAEQVLECLPHAAREILERAAEEIAGGALYLVGGTVRDAMLQTGMLDLDLVVEGMSAEALASTLQHYLGGDLSCHLEFGTCTLRTPSGLMLDLATAREEYYRHPGALPDVTPSTLSKDLSRRDFTINALAVRLTPAPRVLLDPYGGLNDLAEKLLRPLHPLSFVEDPTRIIRGARLGGRLSLTFHPEALRQLEVALHPNILSKVSATRLRAELLITLAEPRVAPALLMLDDSTALMAMFDMQADPAILTALDALRHKSGIPDESYLLVLLLSVPQERLETHRERFHWPRRLIEQLDIIQQLRQADSVPAERLETLGDAPRALLKTLSSTLREQLERYESVPQSQRLRGQDVLDLGLPPGPAVGTVLKRVSKARAEGEVSTFEEELSLAKNLVDKLRLEQDT